MEVLRGLRKYLDVTFVTNLKGLERHGFKVRIEKWLPEEVGTKRQLVKAILCASMFIPRYLALVKKFDVICLQSRTEMIFLTPVLKLMEYKVIWIQHGPFFISQAAGTIKALYRLSSMFVDKIIAVSQDTKRDLIAGGIQKEKITVIYIGVQMSRINKKPHSFTIGFLGTITKEKGIEDFVRIAEGFHTLVIGDGPDRNLVHGPITGFVRGVQRYLRNIDILLLPTRHHEGISMAILEAQAMGIPVLATDIGGNREIITHGYNGFLYALGDTKAMERDILMLSKNRKKLREMGKNGRQRVLERFNMDKQGKLFANFFRSL